MCSQYGELRPTSGWDRFISLGHPTKFQLVSRLGSVTARHVVVGVSQTLRRWIEGATYVRQGDHHVGHWPTFRVKNTARNSPKTSHFKGHFFCGGAWSPPHTSFIGEPNSSLPNQGFWICLFVPRYPVGLTLIDCLLQSLRSLGECPVPRFPWWMHLSATRRSCVCRCLSVCRHHWWTSWRWIFNETVFKLQHSMTFASVWILLLPEYLEVAANKLYLHWCLANKN